MKRTSGGNIRRCRPWSPGQRVARHGYPPGDPHLPYGQFTLCRALRRVNRMCSSTVSGIAYRLSNGRTLCAPTEEKIPLPTSLFRSGRRSLVCARLSNKGKVGVQRGRETAGVPSFLPPPRGAANPPAEVQRKTPRPFGRTACAPRAPRTIGAEKNCRPDKTNTLTQFAHPGQPVLSKTKRGSLS